MTVRPAQAIDEASIGVRTFTAEGQQIGDIPVLITYVSGQYPVDPLLIVTEPIGLVWRAVPPNTYSIVALDEEFEPIPESEITLVAPPGAHDIVVDLILPGLCQADLNHDGTARTRILKPPPTQSSPREDCA